ncbi:MAG: hypothetical protein ACE5KA_04785 [Nitrososphaerales archaeon]
MPLLLYDDTCYLCGKFADTVRRLSCGSIDIVGHYSNQGISIRSKIFPKGFDPTSMFWFVTETQAFGGRSGLFPVAVEIVKNIFRSSSKKEMYSINIPCSDEEMSCNATADFVKRVSMLMKNGKKFKIMGKN